MNRCDFGTTTWLWLILLWIYTNKYAQWFCYFISCLGNGHTSRVCSLICHLIRKNDPHAPAPLQTAKEGNRCVRFWQIRPSPQTHEAISLAARPSHLDTLQPSNPLWTVRLPPARWWAQREKAEWRPRTTPGCRRRPRWSLIHGWVMGYRCSCYSLFYSSEEKGWHCSPFGFLISICLVKITAMSTSKEIFQLYYSPCPSPPFKWHFVLSCIHCFSASVYFFSAFDTINCSESILLLARHADRLC